MSAEIIYLNPVVHSNGKKFQLGCGEKQVFDFHEDSVEADLQDLADDMMDYADANMDGEVLGFVGRLLDIAEKIDE